jgi:uncharacterized membrane protein YhaH (DUF805 family)
MSAAVFAAGFAIFVVFFLFILVFYIAAVWRILEKADQPGWGALIPFYNVYLWVKVAGRPGWWILLLFVPVVSIFVTLILALDVARAFAKSGGFGVGLFLLSFIFIPVLGFGSSTYQGPSPTPLA